MKREASNAATPFPLNSPHHVAINARIYGWQLATTTTATTPTTTHSTGSSTDKGQQQQQTATKTTTTATMENVNAIVRC